MWLLPAYLIPSSTSSRSSDLRLWSTSGAWCGDSGPYTANCSLRTSWKLLRLLDFAHLRASQARHVWGRSWQQPLGWRGGGLHVRLSVKPFAQAEAFDPVVVLKQAHEATGGRFHFESQELIAHRRSSARQLGPSSRP